MQTEHPGAASSLQEGLEETLTVKRFVVPEWLERTLSATNAIENLTGSFRRLSKNVHRWKNAKMIEVRMVAAMIDAGPRSRKIHVFLPHQESSRLRQSLVLAPELLLELAHFASIPGGLALRAQGFEHGRLPLGKHGFRDALATQEGSEFVLGKPRRFRDGAQTLLGDQSSGLRGEREDGGGGESNFTPLILSSASRRHFDNVGCPMPTSWARRLALIAAGPTIL